MSGPPEFLPRLMPVPERATRLPGRAATPRVPLHVRLLLLASTSPLCTRRRFEPALGRWIEGLAAQGWMFRSAHARNYVIWRSRTDAGRPPLPLVVLPSPDVRLTSQEDNVLAATHVARTMLRLEYGRDAERDAGPLGVQRFVSRLLYDGSDTAAGRCARAMDRAERKILRAIAGAAIGFGP